MKDDRGQALAFAVLLLGLAAAVMVGLREAQERILDAVRDERAGEAAATAAGAAIADLQRAAGDLDRRQTETFVSRADVVDAARDAAVRLARANGRADPTDVSVHAYGYEIEVHLALGGRHHIALLEPPP